MTIEFGAELSAIIGLAALVIGGFYYQGMRFDRLIEGQSRRIDDLARRMARIEGLLEGWLSPPRPRQTE